MTITLISTNTLLNQNISAGLLVHTYTADTTRNIQIRILIDQIAGGGAYGAWLRLQRAGVGNIYELIPLTSATPNAGITAIGFCSLWIAVTTGDVITVYVDGLPADIATPDIITDVFDESLTVTASLPSIATLASLMSGQDISILRGDTMILNFTYLGDMTGWTKAWFTVKHDKDDADTQSIIQIVESNPGVATDGLLYIEGAAPTLVGNGSLTVTNVIAGNITVRMEAVEAAKLVDEDSFYFDVQFKTATNTTTLTRGRATIVGDTTRTV